MLASHTARAHVLVAREPSTGTIAGAVVGAAVAAVLILVCSLPFILKCRRKRRLRQRQEEDALRPGMDGVRPGVHRQSQTFSTHATNNRQSHMSSSRLASAAATLSDRDSQTGKEYGPDGITYHRSAAPSPALVGKVLRSCSPAPSLALASSQRNSPAIAQMPFTPPPEPGTSSRTDTFGTLTTEPEQLSRSPTGSIGGAFRRIHDKILHRDTTRSSGSQSRKGTRSSDMDFSELALVQTQTGASAPYLIDEQPVMGGSAEEYYSAATAALAGPGAPAPLSPSSTRDDDQSSEEEEGGMRSRQGERGTLSPPPPGGLPQSSPRGFEPPPSPSYPDPGTVNPMDMMKPSLPSEQAAFVNTELWKLDNSPPLPVDNSPPLKFEPSPTFPPESLPPFQQQEPTPPSIPEPYYCEPESYQQEPEYYQPEPEHYQQEAEHYQQEPTPVPDRPQFQAVVRHPTQMDITTSGQVVPQHEEQVITDISDTSSPGPGFDQYGYAPSPSNHTSPDTRFTDSAYTGSPSPRSSMNSQRPRSIYAGADSHLGASAGDHSRPSSQGDGVSPKPTSFACEECGSRFDQVHKLNHHKRYHERPHQCPQCDKRFGTKTHLDRHINDKHNKTRKYHCTVGGCAYAKQGGGKSFPRKDNWRRHMQNKHSVQNPPEPLEEDVTMEDMAMPV
ncbi:unnamed protein product [Discula destructiva]